MGGRNLVGDGESGGNKILDGDVVGNIVESFLNWVDE